MLFWCMRVRPCDLRFYSSSLGRSASLCSAALAEQLLLRAAALAFCPTAVEFDQKDHAACSATMLHRAWIEQLAAQQGERMSLGKGRYNGAPSTGRPLHDAHQLNERRRLSVPTDAVLRV